MSSELHHISQNNGRDREDGCRCLGLAICLVYQIVKTNNHIQNIYCYNSIKCGDTNLPLEGRCTGTTTCCSANTGDDTGTKTATSNLPAFRGNIYKCTGKIMLVSCNSERSYIIETL